MAKNSKRDRRMNNTLIRNRAFSGTIWKFLERIIAQGISLVVAMVIARNLTPDEYSVVGIVVIFFAFADVFISGGFNTALMQKKDTDIYDYSSVLIISLLLAFLCYGVLYLSAPWISTLYDKPILVPVIRVMSLILPVNAFKSILCAYISSRLEFRKFFFATIGGTILSGIVGIYLAVSGFGPWALVAQQMLNSIIDTVILWATTRIRFFAVFYIERIKTLFSYGWKIFATSIIITIYTQINPLIVGIKYSSASLSFYTKGQSLPSLVSTTCTNTLSAVLFPVLSKYQDDVVALLRYTRKFIKLSSYIIFPSMLGLFAVADNLICLLLTEKWLPAVPFVRVFCIAYMFDVIHVGNCETIKAMGRSDIYLKMEIIKKSCYFLIIGIFVYLTNSPIALSVSAIACTIVAIIVNSVPNIKLINYAISCQIMDMIPNLFMSVLMCLAVVSINVINCNLVLKLFLQIVTGTMFYFLLSIAMKNENYIYLAGIIKERIMKNEQK